MNQTPSLDLELKDEPQDAESLEVQTSKHKIGPLESLANGIPLHLARTCARGTVFPCDKTSGRLLLGNVTDLAMKKAMRQKINHV